MMIWMMWMMMNRERTCPNTWEIHKRSGQEYPFPPARVGGCQYTTPEWLHHRHLTKGQLNTAALSPITPVHAGVDRSRYSIPL
jgi:hypothetical protein